MGKKGKKGKAIDPDVAARQAAAEAEEKKRMDLVRKAHKLKLECEREKKDHDQFLMEREKINYFWIVERKMLTEKQHDLRNKHREYQDLEERQQIELKMLQQQLKHLRYHQQDEVVELKTDAELALKLQEDHHRITEAEIKKDQRSLKVEKKEAEVAQVDFLRMLKMEQDLNFLELRQEFDRKARDMQQKYDLRMKTIREDMEKQRKSQIQKIEDAKNVKISEVMQKNAKDFVEIRNYYNEITTANLDLIKRLKEEYHTIKKTENDHAKNLADLVHRNNQLKEPLKRAHQDVERLENELLAYEEDKKRLADAKEKIRQAETHLRRMEFQHEVLQQQLKTTQGERDELYSKFQYAIYDVQQKAGLRNLLLEKKIDTVDEALETTEAQIDELMASASGMDPATATGISQKLDQVIAWKNGIVSELEEEVLRIKELHRSMVATYESKLAEYGVPPEELGFTPAVMRA